MMNTTLAFQALTNNMTKAVQRTADAPQNARDSEYYLENIGKIKSIDDFLADDRIYRYAMKAYGLGDMAYAKGLMRKVLEGGVDDSSSFANKLSDSRYKEFATAFNFARYGSATTAFDRTQKPVVDKYVRQTFEEEQGAQDDNLRLALYFQRKAPSLTNAFQILADPALLKVVQTAIGLSSNSSSMPIDKQAELIEAKVDFEKLKDPEELQSFLTRFTSLTDVESSAASSANSIVSLIQPSSSIGMSQDVLFSIQKLRLGGA